MCSLISDVACANSDELQNRPQKTAHVHYITKKKVKIKLNLSKRSSAKQLVQKTNNQWYAENSRLLVSKLLPYT